MSRVCEVLSWYGRDNPGTLTNLARMLNHGRLAGSGKMVILPVDQGFEHGPARSFAPNPPAYDPHYHYKLVIKSGCNAYAAPLSFLEAGAREFAGEVPLILKVNDHDVLHDESAKSLCIRSQIAYSMWSSRASMAGVSSSSPVARPPGMPRYLPRSGRFVTVAVLARSLGVTLSSGPSPRR
jgi:DhnA family fructose-bisphosphate aldolase class Ia